MKIIQNKTVSSYVNDRKLLIPREYQLHAVMDDIKIDPVMKIIS